MPLFKTCAVAFTGNKEVYRKGEQVTGSVVVDVTEDVTVKGLRVFCYGESLAKWSEFSPGTFGGTEDYVGKEKYFGLVLTLFGKKQNETGPNHTLTAGRHRYNFRFKLPSDGKLPSSYEGEYGGIRYWLKIEVDRPFPSINQSWHRGFTVLDDIDVNEAKYRNPVKRIAKKQISKALGFGNAGTLTLNASVDRGAYSAGEKIAISAVVSNETSKDMGKLKSQIVQKVVFTAKGEKKTRELVLRVLEGATPITAGQERVWKDQLMEVDLVPPSTKAGSCSTITVSYSVKVLVEVPLAFNLEATIPITIGTVPYGQSVATVRRAAATLEADPSSIIACVKCNRGFQTCHKSDVNFANYSYVPMCTYRPNYVFPPPQPARPAATGRAATTAQRTAGARPKTTTSAQTPRAAAPAQTPRAAVAQTPRPAAPAAAGKAPLPAATVHVPAPGLAPIQAPFLVPPAAMPGARPLDAPLMPPSYDDVLAMSRPPAPAPAADTADAPKQEKADKPYGVLVLRFPDSHIQEFRDTIAIVGPSLAQCKGDVIAVAPQPMLREHNDDWPARTSVAMFMFPTVEAATNWFTKTPRVADPNWLGKCDAFVGTMFEQFKEKNKIFIMAKVRQRKGLPKAKISKFNSMYSKHLRPLRLRKTGVSILNGKQHKMLRGDWLVDGTYQTITQWEDLEKVYEYKAEKKVGPCKEANDIMLEIFETKQGVMFQSEDLTPYHVSLSQPADRPVAHSPEVNHPPAPASAPPLADNSLLDNPLADNRPLSSPLADNRPLSSPLANTILLDNSQIAISPAAVGIQPGPNSSGSTRFDQEASAEPPSDPPIDDRRSGANEESRPTAIALEVPHPPPTASGSTEDISTTPNEDPVVATASSKEEDPTTSIENHDHDQNIAEGSTRPVLGTSVSIEEAISVPADNSEEQNDRMEPVEEMQEESAAAVDAEHDEDIETENCDLQEPAEAIATESPDENDEQGRKSDSQEQGLSKATEKPDSSGLQELDAGGQFDDADDEDEDEAYISEAAGGENETIDIQKESRSKQNEAGNIQNQAAHNKGIQNEVGENRKETVKVENKFENEKEDKPKTDKKKKTKKEQQREAVAC